MSAIKVVASGVALACAAAVAFVAGTRYEHVGVQAAQRSLAALAPVHAAVPVSKVPMVGVYLPGTPHSASPLGAFTRQTSVSPRLVLYFSSWKEPFHTAFADTVGAQGGVPLVQIEPSTTTLPQITDGEGDDYLVSFAQQVRAYGRPVVLSFGHEMNGSWYRWGYRHVTPAQFIAAWRHIVDVFRAQGADNVTWMWTVNVYADAPSLTSPVSEWWPGDGYVDWVGMDGHYIRPTEAFSYVFGITLDSIRKLTKKPVLIAETAISPAAGQAAHMADLFGSVRQDGLLGIVWFDALGNADWRLTGPDVIASFRHAVTTDGFAQGGR